MAARMLLTCNAWGIVASEWSSLRVEVGRAFDVNMCVMEAINTIGRGATALTDFSSVMTVPHRGLHLKTFQKHLKSKFRSAGKVAVASFFCDAMAAVWKFYSEMEPAFTKKCDHSLRSDMDDTWSFSPYWCGLNN